MRMRRNFESARDEDRGQRASGLTLNDQDLLRTAQGARERPRRDRADGGRTLVVAVALEVLANLDGLLDEVVQVLGDLRGETGSLEDAQDLVAGDRLDLGDAVRVAEDDADLRRREALARELEDLLLDLVGRGLEPARRRALVREGRARLWMRRERSKGQRRVSGGDEAREEGRGGRTIPLWGLCMRPILAKLSGAVGSGASEGGSESAREGRRRGEGSARFAGARLDEGEWDARSVSREGGQPQEQLSAPHSRGNLVQLSCPLRDPSSFWRRETRLRAGPRRGGHGATAIACCKERGSRGLRGGDGETGEGRGRGGVEGRRGASRRRRAGRGVGGEVSEASPGRCSTVRRLTSRGSFSERVRRRRREREEERPRRGLLARLDRRRRPRLARRPGLVSPLSLVSSVT